MERRYKRHLEGNAILLINVSVSFQLAAVLDNHLDTEEKQNIDTDNAECGSEDQIEVDVCKKREGTDAGLRSSGSCRVRACRICNKRWRGATQVSTAFKLGICQPKPRSARELCSYSCLKQFLHSRRLFSPNNTKVLASLQCVEPDE